MTARIDLRVPVVTADGRPTPEFQRAFNGLPQDVASLQKAVEALQAQRLADYAAIRAAVNGCIDWLTDLEARASGTHYPTGSRPAHLPPP